MSYVTGVIQANNVSSEAVSDEFMGNGIDLTYEEYIEENGEDAAEDYESNGDSTYLCGFYKKEEGPDKGEYVPDPDASVSAIFRADSNVIQVVRSKWIVRDARWCSPCYPGQADLDSTGGGVEAYTLPEDWFDEYTKPVNQPEYIGEKETLEFRKD
jgi:hypothetical protein